MMLYLQIIAITILLVLAEPVKIFKEWIGFGEEDYLKMKSKFMKSIWRLFSCAMCLSFWITLFIDPLMAPIISIITDIIYKIIMRL